MPSDVGRDMPNEIVNDIEEETVNSVKFLESVILTALLSVCLLCTIGSLVFYYITH